MNFFDWIRDGVRNSVLHGVNDAIEAIGTPEQSDDFHPNMVALLGSDTSTTKPKRKRNTGGTTAAGRKRLGKSLKDMDGAKAS
ncbi:hypothetical protein V7x_21600 [Crateriforma conspicua]|uniref:Uncharacterized protein n=1 Tax=Crateriforma conspicua TaxID=2527996 RepID=A0A5C6FVZ3_9PLAN|nr:MULTISPECIES: hypothetical protein [Crateriforma]TWU66591.1 hypothetical protein V7x_21600 [Crateriforma conspicua]